MQRIDVVNEWSFAKKLDIPYKGVFFFGKSAMIRNNIKNVQKKTAEQW